MHNKAKKSHRRFPPNYHVNFVKKKLAKYSYRNSSKKFKFRSRIAKLFQNGLLIFKTHEHANFLSRRRSNKRLITYPRGILHHKFFTNNDATSRQFHRYVNFSPPGLRGIEVLKLARARQFITTQEIVCNF